MRFDRFVYGHVARISPERADLHPASSVGNQDAGRRFGGNVARNIVALGGEALLVDAALGRDTEGDLIADLVDLERSGRGPLPARR